MSIDVPVCVSDFLMISKNIQDLQEQQKICREKLTQLQQQVGDFLKTVPEYELPLSFVNNELQLQKFGNPGKLRFGIERRKEYLSQKSLTEYLFEWNSSVYPHKTQEEVEETSKAAAAHVWKSRKVTRMKPTVVRTFSKKRKHKL
jgi:hypothetical protein